MKVADGAFGAVRPWNSLDAGKPITNALPQQEIDRCLSCTYCADACDRCDGKGNLAGERGRPRAQYDAELLRELLRLKRCRADICAALNISTRTLARAKSEILKEETQS